MAQQTLTGNSKSLGAIAAGGTIIVSPSEYPQVISGVILSSVPVVGTIDAITGNFSVSVTQGARVKVKGKDGAGKTFLNVNIQISTDNTANISAYVPAIQSQANPVEPYVTTVNTLTGDVTVTPDLIDAVPVAATAGVTPTNSSTTIENLGDAIILTYTTESNTSSIRIDINGIHAVGSGMNILEGTLLVGNIDDNTSIEADGTLKFNGRATVFTDMVAASANVKTQGNRIVFDDAENAITFPNTCVYNTDWVWFSLQLPHTWKLGSTIYPHIHYQQTNNATPNFLYEYRWQTHGQTKTTAWTKLPQTTNVFGYLSGTLNQIIKGAGITPPVNAGLSDIIQFRISRDMNNSSGAFSGNDLYTGSVTAISADVHIEQDTIGSRNEYIK